MYLYKIVAEDNWTGLSGFKSRSEAESKLPHMKKDKKWTIKSYKANKFELN